jgi:DNA-binding IclR family transcriptional regulator
MTMAISTAFRTIELETGTFAVVRTDAAKPLVLEVVATFYDASRADEYAARQNAQPSAREEPKSAPKAAPKAILKSVPKTAPKKKTVEPDTAALDLTDRQGAVLGALRVMMDAGRLVEAKAAILAEAAKVPLGSLHSILQSLEKKALIRTERSGSAKAPAVYEVL